MAHSPILVSDSSDPLRAASTVLENVLRTIGETERASRIFTLWPRLRKASLRICRYLSPLLITPDGGNLLEHSIQRAIDAFHAPHCLSETDRFRAFIEALCLEVGDLCAIAVSVKTATGDWILWSFDEPVVDWMRNNRARVIQIRLREEPLARFPVAFALLKGVFSASDLQIAGSLHGLALK